MIGDLYKSAFIPLGYSLFCTKLQFVVFLFTKLLVAIMLNVPVVTDNQATLDAVETLMKKHEAFEKSAATQEERFAALEKLTTVSFLLFFY